MSSRFTLRRKLAQPPQPEVDEPEVEEPEETRTIEYHSGATFTVRAYVAPTHTYLTPGTAIFCGGCMSQRFTLSVTEETTSHENAAGHRVSVHVNRRMALVCTHCNVEWHIPVR